MLNLFNNTKNLKNYQYKTFKLCLCVIMSQNYFFYFNYVPVVSCRNPRKRNFLYVYILYVFLIFFI